MLGLPTLRVLSSWRKSFVAFCLRYATCYPRHCALPKAVQDVYI